jgi:3-phosphoshikimate 1-carboxyvinyltransferase
LLLAGLAAGTSRLHGCLEADDTSYMKSALQQLGAGIDALPDGSLEVRGCAGRPGATEADLFLGNAGTAMRFLAAAVTLGSGAYRLDGEPRMRRRPVRELAAALAGLGVDISFDGANGFPPWRLSGGPLQGGQVELQAGRSSQFLSALLMAGPCTPQGLEIALKGPVASRPYVDLTLDLMRAFGGPEMDESADRFRIPGGSGYRATELKVEADASSAAALLASAAVSAGQVTVTGISRNTRQPDGRFPDLLAQMGCQVRWEGEVVDLAGGPLSGIRADLSECPDLAPVLTAVALFAAGPTRIHGAPHLRLKESDRIGDLAGELRKLGAVIDEHPDGLTVHPGPLHGSRLDPHRDHRLAMAFALVGLVVDGVEIENPGCVGKSFPGFFDALDSLEAAS